MRLTLKRMETTYISSKICTLTLPMFVRLIAHFAVFVVTQVKEGAYTMSMEELLHYVEKNWQPTIREFHIVGGHIIRSF